MLFGDTNLFAVECEVQAETPDGFRLGHFRFWIGAVPVGDWEDVVYLNGVESWMYEFAYQNINRFEPTLEHSSAEELFRELYHNVMYTKHYTPLLDDIHRRFHISHLGMSAFDHVRMILFESSTCQRVIWQVSEGDIQEQLLPPGEMQRIAKEFCDWAAH